MAVSTAFRACLGWEPEVTQAACPSSQVCRCFIPNRGLYSCQSQSSNDDVGYALAPDLDKVAFQYSERPGLQCMPSLPRGVAPMSLTPPRVKIKGIVDLDSAGCPKALHKWAISRSGGRGFYRFFTHAAGALPLFSAPGVSSDLIAESSDIISQFLLATTLDPQLWLDDLVAAKVRIALAPEGDPAHVWRNHPEVQRDFITGLGGASRLFPTVGASIDGSCHGWFELLEELFHTIQYVVLTPREVCLYHIAYREAVTAGIYRPEVLEEAGEPVPTMQADEYFASALIVWFGGVVNLDEYKVLGNGPSSTGRQNLWSRDRLAFCLLANLFQANDTWTPCSGGSMLRFPNRPVEYNSKHCEELVLSQVARCPGPNTSWLSSDGPGPVRDNSITAVLTTFVVAMLLVCPTLVIVLLHRFKKLPRKSCPEEPQPRNGKYYGRLSASEDAQQEGPDPEIIGVISSPASRQTIS